MFEGPTHTDELIAIIKANAPRAADLVKEYYDTWNPTELLKGPLYYRNKTDILHNKKYTYQNGNRVEDIEATNEKVPSGMHKVLVDQKVAYLAGEPMVFGSRSDNKATLELLEEIIGEQWEDVLPELIKNVSNKGLEWLHPFINEDGDFDYMIMEAENVIPVYDPANKKKLVAVIRFYALSVDVVKLELWTDVNVTYFELIKGKMFLDASYAVNPAPHFTTLEGEPKSWGRVPFIKFANNQEELSDLEFNKQAIDAYEKLVSNAQTTLEDMPEIFMALIGYEGESLQEFREMLKRYRVFNLDEGGDLKTFSAQVPTDAYSLQAEILRKTIVTSGQGVDPSPDVIGDAPSGVALENLYSLLDMKASMLERKFTLALRLFMYFIEVYCRENPKINVDFNYRDITFTFNKMLLTNELEIIQMGQQSMGIISKRTIMENHPWVKDIVVEEQRIEDEKSDITPMMDDDDDEQQDDSGGETDD